jgi:hypothetical protein
MAGEPAPAAAPPQPGVLTGTRYDAPPAPPAKADEAAWSKMTIGERYNYARQFPQGPDALPATDPATPPAPGDRPAPAPAAGEKIKVGSLETSEAELVDLLKFKADRLAQQVGVPPDPSGYKIQLKADLALPEDVQIQFDEADPAIADLRRFAHANNLSQSQVEDVLGIYALREAPQPKAS